MTFESSSPSAFAAWGKTDSAGMPAHHLAHHSMDVAAVFEALLEVPQFRSRLESAAGNTLSMNDAAWLAAFVFLHDVGKLSPAFQARAWPDTQRLITRSHLDEGAAWLNGLDRRRDAAMDGMAMTVLMPLVQAGREIFQDWCSLLLAHHGRPVGLGARFSFAKTLHYDWEVEERAMGQALRAWFPTVADGVWPNPDLLQSKRAAHLVAGLLALADWIGSDGAHFPFVRSLDIAGYAARARAQARSAVRALELNGGSWPNAAPSFADLTGHSAPRGAQELIGGVPADASLVLLEAETGSGKTEAALWHFAKMRSAGVVDALYFAVPTRAAAGQLFARVQDMMSRIGGPEAILAVPGLLRAGEAEGRRLPGFEVLWDDGRRHWAAEHATRFLAAPVAVGTVDQALMAGLKVKHAHLRGAALSRSLLVIDEVHASDAYMNAVARRLVRDHLSIDGRAMLMSATLGAAERAAWLGEAPMSLDDAIHAPYPALWVAGGVAPRVPEDAEERPKRVWPRAIPTMDPVVAAEQAVEAAARGARVLVIRNTVDAAVATWRGILDCRPDLCLTVEGRPALHHSRFAAEDRHLLDAAIETTFGKGSSTGGVVAVGTQTLEQSLDICADLLITDLCPMDVLLQRIGRLHRHRRLRPAGFEEATVHVLCPEGGLGRLAEGPCFEKGLGGWLEKGVLQGIYIDLRGIEATRRLLDEDVWTIPAENRRLVEAATHPEALATIEVEMGWGDYATKVEAKGLAEGAHGGALALDRSARFPSAADYPNVDETVQTRLGARGPVYTLPKGTIGPFGHHITRLAPPAHWCFGLTGDESVKVSAELARLVITFGDQEFLYWHEGLSRR